MQGFQRIIPRIMGWIVLVITLALAPTIETYNGHVTTNVSGATNSANMLGMTAVDDYGGFIIIMSLLASGGFMVFMGTKGRLAGAGIRDMLEVIGMVIVTIISLAMFSGSVIGYFDALITASTGFAQTAYGALVIIVYLGIISMAGVTTYTKTRRISKGRRRSARSAFM